MSDDLTGTYTITVERVIQYCQNGDCLEAPRYILHHHEAHGSIWLCRSHADIEVQRLRLREGKASEQ